MTRQIKSVKLCEWCDRPFHVTYGNYRAKFCCSSHNMLYQWRVAGRVPRDLVPSVSEPVSTVDD